MKNLSLETETENKTIVAFKVGRGGHFNNAGFTSYYGEFKISSFTDNLFLQFNNNYEINKKIGDRENLKQLVQLANDDCPEYNQYYERLKNWGLDLGEPEYFSEGGHPVDLTEAQSQTGIGRIDLDGDYNTIYTCYLKDCSDEELILVYKEDPSLVKEYLYTIADDQTIDVLDEFECLIDVLKADNLDYNLDEFDIEEITKEQYQDDNNGFWKTKIINNRFYKID